MKLELTSGIVQTHKIADFDELMKTAERNLNDAMRHFGQEPGGLAQEFVELKLHSCIFQYDICTEMVTVIRNQATGFAACVALKGLVLRLFEYDLALNDHWIPRLMALCDAREMPPTRGRVRDARAAWKTEFKQLRGWASVRNKAAGHYDADLLTQVRLLQGLSLDGVLSVARAFLSFNMTLLQSLREVGLGRLGTSE